MSYENFYGAEKLGGKEVIRMFLVEFVDNIKVLKIDIMDNKDRQKDNKILMNCDEMIHAARSLMQSLDSK